MLKNNKIICVIPARAGSKRIPGKNKYEFQGQTLVEWSIKASILCDYIDETILSSNDDDIIDIGKKYGLTIHHRSKELSSDTASSFDLLKDIYFNLINKNADIIITLQPTSPLREKDLLNNSLEYICLSNNWSSAIELFPWKQFTGKIINNFWVPDFPEDTRSQEIPTKFIPSGRFFAYNCNETIKLNEPLGNRVVPLYTEEWNNVNIDDYTDLEKMEYIFSQCIKEYLYLIK